MHSWTRIARATTVALGVLLTFAPARVHAVQGINLAWNQCLGEGTGVQNVNFACNTNTGTQKIVGSYVLENDYPTVIGAEVVLELASAGAALPPWWQYRNAGSCRQNALSVTLQPNPADVVCEDWSGLQAQGGLAAYCTSAFQCPVAPSANNVAIIKLVSAVPQEAARDLTGGVEYFDFNILINHTKTVGTGSCAGCDVPVCIVLNSINVVDRGNASRFLATPTGPGTNVVTWQGGGVPVTPRGAGCPAATPTTRSTWGSVKSLYR